jgi:hypothetical protein
LSFATRSSKVGTAGVELVTLEGGRSSSAISVNYARERAGAQFLAEPHQVRIVEAAQDSGLHPDETFNRGATERNYCHLGSLAGAASQ